MIIITVPHPTDPGYDERHGVARWVEQLEAGHRVWHIADGNIRELDGERSSDCQQVVRGQIAAILADPAAFGIVGHGNLVAVTANLTRLFFTLGHCPEGVVQVETR
jgi:hypothetical protein